jgi:pyroglutamyl-peptidase
MNKILVTGFEPFLQHALNPSKEVLSALADASVVTLLLPVSYAKAMEILLPKIESEKPDYIVGLGLAASRDAIALEQKAFNEATSSQPDNDGVTKTAEAIIPKGLHELDTTIDLNALKSLLAAKGIEAKTSLDPGRYVCNEVYYLALSSGAKSLFVHLPSPETSSLEVDKAAVAAIVGYLKELK